MGTFILIMVLIVVCLAGLARGIEIRKTEQATRDTAEHLAKLTRHGFER